MADTSAYYDLFFPGIKENVDRVSETQAEKLDAVANKCADAIAAGRWVHTFGTGHSSIPGMETFPRIGSIFGFHQLNELNLSFNGQVVGGSSMIVSCIIMNGIVAQTEAALQHRGYMPTIWPSHNVYISPEEYALMEAQEEKVNQEYGERLARS